MGKQLGISSLTLAKTFWSDSTDIDSSAAGSQSRHAFRARSGQSVANEAQRSVHRPALSRPVAAAIPHLPALIFTRMRKPSLWISSRRLRNRRKIDIEGRQVLRRAYAL
jgi:hypothetical protein